MCKSRYCRCVGVLSNRSLVYVVILLYFNLLTMGGFITENF